MPTPTLTFTQSSLLPFSDILLPLASGSLGKSGMDADELVLLLFQSYVLSRAAFCGTLGAGAACKIRVKVYWLIHSFGCVSVMVSVVMRCTLWMSARFAEQWTLKSVDPLINPFWGSVKDDKIGGNSFLWLDTRRPLLLQCYYYSPHIRCKPKLKRSVVDPCTLIYLPEKY